MMHHLFYGEQKASGEGFFCFSCDNRDAVFFSSASTEAASFQHSGSVVFGVSEEDRKQHSREPEVCNCIPTDNRLEQQRVPRGRQINRGAWPASRLTLLM